MPRDKVIRKSFEIADDGMQGVIAYCLYGLACKQSASEDKILVNLPEKAIQITHDWVRFYTPTNLIQAMNDYFEPYHARVSLISIISIFEGALANFIDRLVVTKKMVKPRKSNYKARLEWAFDMSLQSKYANVSRIPYLCLDIDHARRIRNLWMHNNGLFDKGYEDCISVSGHTPIIDPSYLEYKNGRKKKVPVILKTDGFLKMGLSHIELLHQLHHSIQKTHFGQIRSYSYVAARKRIEWHRLLIGI